MTWSPRPTLTSVCLLHQLSALARASNSMSRDALRKSLRESELRLGMTYQHLHVSRYFNFNGMLNLNHFVFSVRNMILENAWFFNTIGCFIYTIPHVNKTSCNIWNETIPSSYFVCLVALNPAQINYFCFDWPALILTSLRPSWKGCSVRLPRPQRRQESRHPPSWHWSPLRKRSEKERCPALSGGTPSSWPTT